MPSRVDWKGGLTGLAISGCMVAISQGLPQMMPDGLSAGDPRVYEGLLTVPSSGWRYAKFDTLALLKENERNRSQGKQRVEEICFLPDDDRGPRGVSFHLGEADRYGIRSAWVRMVAQPRFATGACMNQRRDSHRRQWGRYLRVLSVTRSDPIACDHVTFVVGRRRCAAGERVYGD